MKKKKYSGTVTVKSGGRTTGPMKGDIDKAKFRAVAGPAVEQAAAEQKPAGKVKRTSEYLRYDFTRAELVERAQELARTLQEIARLEDNLASMKKQIQSQVAEQEAKRNRLSNCVAAGYEMRDVICEVRFNVPASKLKTIVRMDSKEVVEVKSMDSFECQEELNFEKAADREEKKGSKDGEPEKPAETATPAQAAAAAPVPEPEKPAAPSTEAPPPA